MSAGAECAVVIDSDGLRLEGLFREGTAFAAIALHPHPQYGGDMHNHVVAAICEALASRGATTLRFNTRGTGRSDGSFDNGRGEADDARAAVRTVREVVPGVPLLLAGYSFGAMVAASVAGDVRPDALILVSPPLQFAALPALPEGMRALVVTGDHDPIAPAAAVAALEGPLVRAAVARGVDHSWWPGIESLVDEVCGFVETGISGVLPP